MKTKGKAPVAQVFPLIKVNKKKKKLPIVKKPSEDSSLINAAASTTNKMKTNQNTLKDPCEQTINNRSSKKLKKKLKEKYINTKLKPIMKMTDTKNTNGPPKADSVSTGKKKREKYKNSKESSLREKMLSRLSAARFRYINEELYTWDGQSSNSVFTSNPKSFKAYHSGFKQQAKLWPVNPIDLIIKSIKNYPNFEKKVIADFGCGEAKLSLELSSNKVYSFDLVALNERVTVADNANTNLYSGSVDVAVHCLSLMSSNLTGYIKEVNRVLKIGGILKIAEVESRFEDVNKFVSDVCKFNFKLIKNDLSHNLFYFMDFEKINDIGIARKRKLPVLTLLPCLYKKR